MSKKKKSKNGGFIWGLVFLLISGFLLGSFWWLYNLWQDIYVTVAPEEQLPGLGDSQNKRESLPDVLTVLLLGLDSMDGVSRTDAIMVLSLHKSGEMSLVSIPRDMRVEIPGHGLDKINHAHAYGGVPLVLKTVEEFLDIKIDHYATTDFEGFVNIIDILGGIEIDVEKKMYHKGKDVTIDLQPGLQVLNGEKALQYVRFRSDSEGDFGRVRRQQQLVKVLAAEVLRPANLLKIPRLLPEVAQNVRTDLELNQALILAGKLKDLNLGEINSITLPGKSGNINGVSYVIPDDEKIAELVDCYINFTRSTAEQRDDVSAVPLS